MKNKIVMLGMGLLLFAAGVGIGMTTVQGDSGQEDTVQEDVVQAKTAQEGTDQQDAKQETKEYVTTERKAPKSVKSNVKDKEDCYLCGDHQRSVAWLYNGYDDLGVICVNEWYIFDVMVRNHADDGSLTGPSGSASSRYTGNAKKEDCLFYAMSNSDRGISEVDVSYGKNSYLDTEAVREKLCQGCLDKLWEVMEVRVPEGEDANPRDLCLVDFNTLELYSLQGIYSGFSAGDYWVEVDTSDEDRLQVRAIYAPILYNGTKEGE